MNSEIIVIRYNLYINARIYLYGIQGVCDYKIYFIKSVIFFVLSFYFFNDYFFMPLRRKSWWKKY